MPREKVLGKDIAGRKIVLVSYEDGGRQYHDLFTDGRILLSKSLARSLAVKLLEFAGETI